MKVKAPQVLLATANLFLQTQLFLAVSPSTTTQFGHFFPPYYVSQSPCFHPAVVSIPLIIPLEHC